MAPMLSATNYQRNVAQLSIVKQLREACYATVCIVDFDSLQLAGIVYRARGSHVSDDVRSQHRVQHTCANRRRHATISRGYNERL